MSGLYADVDGRVGWTSAETSLPIYKFPWLNYTCHEYEQIHTHARDVILFIQLCTHMHQRC